MAEYHIGSVKQATFDSGNLEWKRPEKTKGNVIRVSSILEMDVTLNTEGFHLCIPYDGAEPYRVDGQFMWVKKGQYLVLQPGQLARGEGNLGKEIRGLCILLNQKTISEANSIFQLPIEKSLNGVCQTNCQSVHFMPKIFHLHENALGQLLENLLPKMMEEQNVFLFDEETFYVDLAFRLIEMQGQIGKQLQTIPYLKNSTKQEIYSRISGVRHFLLENYSEPIGLEDLEKIALFSKYHIVRLYRSLYGITPYQHLLQLRMEKAKSLLLKNYSPTEVAYQLSFSDRRAFRKIFKKFTGIAPADFIQKT